MPELRHSRVAVEPALAAVEQGPVELAGAGPGPVVGLVVAEQEGNLFVQLPHRHWPEVSLLSDGFSHVDCSVPGSEP